GRSARRQVRDSERGLQLRNVRARRNPAGARTQRLGDRKGGENARHELSDSAIPNRQVRPETWRTAQASPGRSEVTGGRNAVGVELLVLRRLLGIIFYFLLGEYRLSTSAPYVGD